MLTENKLLAGFDCATNGGDYRSFVETHGWIYWTYRRDGAVCYRDDADCILTSDGPGSPFARVELGARYSAAGKRGIAKIESLETAERESIEIAECMWGERW